MKALVLVASLVLATAAQASSEKSFVCKNSNGTLVATESKLSVLREVSRKRFDIVTRQFVNLLGMVDGQSSDATMVPEKNAILVYTSEKNGVKQYDVLTIQDLTDRKTISADMDKGGYGVSTIEESYKVKALVALSDLPALTIDLDCVELTTLDNR